MKYRIYHNTTRYGNETRGLELFGGEVLVECSSVDTALALADAMSGYADAGLTDQYLVECPECGHSDIEECGGRHVLPDRTESIIASFLDASIDSAWRCTEAILLAGRYGGIDGDHHKTWVIDQIVRVLTGCKYRTVTAIDCNRKEYQYKSLDENDSYKKIVADICATGYEWSIGIAP